MTKKLRTCRAVEANQGTQKAFAKKLLKLQKDYEKMVRDEIFKALESEGMLATDAAPDEQPKDSSYLHGAFATGAADFVDRFIKRNAARWLKYVRGKADKLGRWFVRRMWGDTGNAQKTAFKAAGVPGQILVKTKFGIPVVTRQHVSKQAANAMSDYIERITNLITKTTQDETARLQEVLVESLESGQSLRKIKQTLNTFSSFDERRADRVALDQANKLNQEIQRQNALSFGAKEAVWVHVPGTYTSRESHMKMDGKKFDLVKGMWDPEVEKWIQPSELPYCRCIKRIVIPEDNLIE